MRPLIFILISFFSISLYAGLPVKTSLSGKITDKETGAPVIGAKIYLPDLKTGAISNIDGTFKIENLPQSNILVSVSMIGYRSISETIDLSKITTMDFALQPSVIETNPVIVTGTSKATELKRNPVPSIVVNSQYISQQVSTNAIDALNKIPGLSTLTTGPNVSKPFIHGLGSNRVLTLFDGVRQEGQQWGDEHGIEVDQYLVDHIEVIKGPASLMYGSDALAGVVNLLPKPTPLPGSVNGSILGNYLTNNKQLGISADLNANSKGFLYGGRVSHKQASDYQNPYDGRVYGTKFNENDVNAFFGVNKAWGFSRFNMSIFDNRQEIPDGSRDSATGKFTRLINEETGESQIVSDKSLNNYNIDVLHQRVQHYRFNTSNNFIFGNNTLGVNLGLQKSIRREFSHPAYPEIAGLFLNLVTFSYDLKYNMTGWKHLEKTFGINGMIQDNDASQGTEMVIPSYHNFDFGPFVHVKKTMGKWDVSGGLRYDIRVFSNDSMFTQVDPQTGFQRKIAYNPNDSTVVRQFGYYKHTFSGISGSVGAAYNMNERWTFKANVARGFRAPNAAEISAKGVHPGTGFEQLGDLNFLPEFSLQEDMGAFFNSKHLLASIEIFNNNLSNYIYNEKLLNTHGGDSIFSQNGADFPVFKFRQTQAHLYGAELSVDLHPHPIDWLHFENSISWMQAINTGANTYSTKYLPLIPPLHTNTELKADVRKKIGGFSNIFVKAGVEYYATQNHFYSAYGTETATPSYTLISAGLGGDFLDKKGKTLFSLSIIGSNIANVAYQSNMNRLKYFIATTSTGEPIPGPTGHYGIYNMGRNISFRLLIPFEKTKK